MVHPAAIPGASVSGSEILRELPSAEGVVLFSLFTTALFWSCGAENRVPELAAVERQALAQLNECACWAGIAVIARHLASTTPADRDELAQACFCVADWASGHNARETALAFTLLAALIVPRHPRYAWAAGRMLRSHGRMREAEFWYRRSHRVAVWMRDAYGQSISLSSLGVLAYIAGSQSKAERRLEKALLVASRHGLRILEGEILHNLMLLEMERHEFARAEEYAARVVERYLPDHERLPALAHDIACLWMEQGHFARALPVLCSLVPRFTDPVEKFQVFAALVRAAGGAGDKAAFASAWVGADACLPLVQEESLHAGAFLDLGRGAASLASWDQAVSAFQRAELIARSRGEADVLFKVESALDAVRRREGADHSARTVPQRYGTAAADSIARNVIQALQPALTA
ncbi:MAG TPA: hypothetical protein VF092_06895 [Longimicrobium sp.]